MKQRKNNRWLLILGVIVLATIPIINLIGAEFEGADDQAADMVLELNPSYEPWIEPPWEPGSDRAEFILFFAQAIIGVGLIGSYFHSKIKNRQDKEV